MITQSTGELLRSLRINGHRARVKDGQLLITPGKGGLTEEQTEAIKASRYELVKLLGSTEVRQAMYSAVDAITKDWPRTGPVPVQSLEVMASEAAMDAACAVEPMDSERALAAIQAWCLAWVEVVRSQKGGRR